MEAAQEVEIWAPILDAPLDWPPSSLPSQVGEYFTYVYGVDDVEINKFTKESKDEQLHQQYLGDLIVKGNWRRGLRGPRKRKIYPSESGRKNFQGRKNNEPWTHGEVKKLIKGVDKYGEGRWTMVKKYYFSPSVRNPTNLKDKWRNMKRACGVPSTSKRKVKAQKTMYRPLGTKQMEQIQWLASLNKKRSKG